MSHQVEAAASPSSVESAPAALLPSDRPSPPHLVGVHAAPALSSSLTAFILSRCPSVPVVTPPPAHLCHHGMHTQAHLSHLDGADLRCSTPPLLTSSHDLVVFALCSAQNFLGLGNMNDVLNAMANLQPQLQPFKGVYRCFPVVMCNKANLEAGDKSQQLDTAGCSSQPFLPVLPAHPLPLLLSPQSCCPPPRWTGSPVCA